MPDEPYRPEPTEPEGSAELARLAAAGERRIALAREGAAVERARKDAIDRRRAERHASVALGGHYGSPVRVVAVAVAAAGALALAVGLLRDEAAATVPGLFALLGGFLARVYAPPVASRARWNAEMAWIASRPFPLDGYLDVLGASPRSDVRLRAILTWSAPALAPKPEVLRALVGTIDPGATVVAGDDATSIVESSAISGATAIRTDDAAVYRNTRVVPYLHRLVDDVLVPLHHRHAVARVTLARA